MDLPPNRGSRFWALEQPYIQDIDVEVPTLDAQVNASHEVVDRGTLRKIVQFALLLDEEFR